MRLLEIERQLIAYIADRNKRGQAARKAVEPEVGIFFLYNGEVLIDSKPLCVTEPYGKFNSADSEYGRHWKFGQRYDVVPRNIEYDQVPRGRVEYDVNEGKFHDARMRNGSAKKMRVRGPQGSANSFERT